MWIPSVILDWVEVQSNWIIRNKKWRFLARLDNDVWFFSEHITWLHQPKTYEQGIIDWQKQVLDKVEELIEEYKKEIDSEDPDYYTYNDVVKTVLNVLQSLLPKNETDDSKSK